MKRDMDLIRQILLDVESVEVVGVFAHPFNL